MILRAALNSTKAASRGFRSFAAPRVACPLAMSRPPTWTTRHQASTSAHDLQPLGGETTLISAPTQADLEREEIDVELALLKNASVRITERAAEQLRSISMRENDPKVALRVAVESGGCHGYQYKVELTSVEKDQSLRGDFVFEHPKRRPSQVVVDTVSLTLLQGSTIDFATELIGSSFRVVDNPQASGGCGCGVSWEAKIDDTVPSTK